MEKLPRHIELFLKGEGLSLQGALPGSTGASGAMVFQTPDAIIKIVGQRSEVEHLVKAARKEHRFYRASAGLDFDHLPKAIAVGEAGDDLVLALRRYRALDIAQWDLPFQLMAADLCAKLHSIPLHALDALALEENIAAPSPQEVERAQGGWRDLLMPLALWDGALMQRIADAIAPAASFLKSLPRNFVHGDFFCHNLVWDQGGERLVLIDWQNYGMGRRGDLSFFINIGASWSMEVHRQAMIDRYLSSAGPRLGPSLTPHALDVEFAASDLITDYVHWWMYLKNGPERRIRMILARMIDCLKRLERIS